MPVGNRDSTWSKPARRPAPAKSSTSEASWVRIAAFSEEVQLITELVAADRDRSGKRPVGRPRQYDDFVMAVIYVLTGRFSVRMIIESILPEPATWNIIRRAHIRRYGHNPEFVAPTRAQYYGFLHHRLTPRMDEIHAILCSQAVSYARTMGLFDTGTARDLRHPDGNHTVYGDGTVLSPPIKAPASRHELTPRQVALGGDFYAEAGQDHVFYGIAYTSLLARPVDRTHRRIVLDVRRRPAKGEGGEAGQGVDMTLDLHALLNSDGHRGRIDAVVWDGAFRGIHASLIGQATGALVVRPHHANSTPRPFRYLRDCPCRQVHELWTADGTICLRSVDGEGGITYQPVPHQRVRCHPNADGTHRQYLEFDLPCGHRQRERFDLTAEQDTEAFHRAEHIQPLAPGSPAHREVYGRREDAESRHAELDATMRHKRLPYYIPVHQDLFMLAEALIANTRTSSEWRHAHGAGPPGTPARIATGQAA